MLKYVAQIEPLAVKPLHVERRKRFVRRRIHNLIQIQLFEIVLFADEQIAWQKRSFFDMAAQ